MREKLFFLNIEIEKIKLIEIFMPFCGLNYIKKQENMKSQVLGTVYE